MNNTKRIKTAVVFLFIPLVSVFLLVLCEAIGTAANKNISLEELIKETQKMSPKPNEMTMVWWIPEEFWQITFSQGEISEEDVKELLAVVSPYTIFVVVEGKIGVIGNVTYSSEDEILNKLKVIDTRGVSRVPLIGDETETADIKTFMSILKPIIANMLGPLGENMHFFLFPSSDEDGKKIYDPMKEGTFTILLGEEEFKWRLPLGSLLSPKVCPKCGEKLSGAYKYCPWDGTKLPETGK
ncbi:MAG: zinc ribbon domain-containing protein [bacterium]